LITNADAAGTNTCSLKETATLVIQGPSLKLFLTPYLLIQQPGNQVQDSGSTKGPAESDSAKMLGRVAMSKGSNMAALNMQQRHCKCSVHCSQAVAIDAFVKQ